MEETFDNSFVVAYALELHETCEKILQKLEEMDKKLAESPSENLDKRLTIVNISSLLQMQDAFIKRVVEMDATSNDQIMKIHAKIQEIRNK